MNRETAQMGCKKEEEEEGGPLSDVKAAGSLHSILNLSSDRIDV